MKEHQQYAVDQVEHCNIYRDLVLNFCTKLMKDANSHDTSKFSDKEYDGFISNQLAFLEAKTGFDSEYQKGLKSEAIQHHILNNKHHPEYWSSRKKVMPLEYVILMFFDWLSRSIQKGDDMDSFWSYNISKLDDQVLPKEVVHLMRLHYKEYTQ